MRYAARLANLTFRLRPACHEERPIGGIYKRGFDIIGAIAGIVLLSPLLILHALLVKFSDGGRVLYGHQRVGRNGGTFLCLKFRTMAENGDEILMAHFASNPRSREEWLATRKLQDDPRVTRVGLVLRKLSLGFDT